MRNTKESYPTYQTTIMNVQGFPNISLVCFHGTAFATTSRDMDALTLTPSLNAFCASK